MPIRGSDQQCPSITWNSSVWKLCENLSSELRADGRQHQCNEPLLTASQWLYHWVTSYKNKLLPHIDWHEDWNIEYHHHTPHSPGPLQPGVSSASWRCNLAECRRDAMSKYRGSAGIMVIMSCAVIVPVRAVMTLLYWRLTQSALFDLLRAGQARLSKATPSAFLWHSNYQRTVCK